MSRGGGKKDEEGFPRFGDLGVLRWKHPHLHPLEEDGKALPHECKAWKPADSCRACANYVGSSSLSECSAEGPDFVPLPPPPVVKVFPLL